MDSFSPLAYSENKRASIAVVHFLDRKRCFTVDREREREINAFFTHRVARSKPFFVHFVFKNSSRREVAYPLNWKDLQMNNKERTEKPVSWKISIILCIAIISATSVILYYVYSTEPTAENTGALEKSAMLVEVVKVQHGNFRPTISVLAKVEPAIDVIL